MREHQEFICVTCPVGCAIDAIVEDGELVSTEGQTCQRGVAFVREELESPKRMLTTTVQVKEGKLVLVSVRSVSPLPKSMLVPVARALRKVIVQAPVSEHQVIMADALGTGVDIVASRGIDRL